MRSMRPLDVLLRKLKTTSAAEVTIRPALWTRGRFLASAAATRITVEAVEAELLQRAGARRDDAGTMELPTPA